MFMYVCMPESTLSFRVFEIDAIIFTFFFRVPNQALSLSLSCTSSLVSFFCRGEKKQMRQKKRAHTENKHKR